MASTAAVLNILVNASTGKAQAELTALDKRLKGTAAQGAATSGFMGGKFSKGMAVGAAGAAAFAAAAVVAGKELYNVGEELDAAYDKIRTGTGATGKQLEKLKKDFRSVARQVPDDFATTGTAIADLNTRLGLSGRPLRLMSRNMLNLSRITETDLEGNIKSVARAFVDWEVPIKRQAGSLDGLFRLSQRSGASVAEIADNMQKFGSPLRTLGFEVGEAAAMFAQFERAGVNMQTMVPGLKLAIGNLADPTEDLRGTLEGLGVAVENPRKGLRQIMDLIGNQSNLKPMEKMTLAMDVFGKRAGADMAEAVKQGRFNLDSFVRTFAKGSDTIEKTARDTNDTGENMAIFWNKVKIAVAPAAEWVQGAVSDMSLALSRIPLNRIINDVKRFFKSNQDLKDVLKVVGGALRVFGKVAGVVWSSTKETFRGLVQYLEGGFKMVRGIVRAVSRAFRGDWKGAWDAVKEIFRGAVQLVLGILRAMTAPVRTVVGKVAGSLKGTFKSAWGTVKSIFRDGKNAVIDVVNSIIKVLNKIPGVDIGEIPNDLSGSGSYDANSHKGKGYQRGGPIFGGKPSGDSIPAMLERGEYVLNRKAVRAVGKKQLDAVNFGAAPRFQVGGAVGLITGGDVWGAAQDAAGMAANGLKQMPGVGAAAGLAGDVLGKGAGWFIGKLPKPDLPQPFKGLGPWLIEHVEKWIKGRVPKASASGGSWSGGSGKYPGVSGDTDFLPALGMALSRMSRAAGQSISVQSGWRSYAEQAALYEAWQNGTGNLAAPPGSSNHESGRAADITPGSEVFGSMAGRFGLGFTVPGESWHIELLKRGGLVGLMRGGAAEHGVVRNVGKFLLNRGFDFRATAGILGNAWREGLWNPAQMEFTGAHNGGLYGFTTSPVSLQDMKNFASRRGKPWDDEIVQTNFMLSHGNPPGIQLRGAMNRLDTIAQTTEYFMSNWERPLASAAGLSERIAAGFDASTILRRAGIVKAGAEGNGPSPEEKAKAARRSRKQSRLDQVDKLLRTARGAKSVQGKKGAYWRILDLFANFGDFGFRKGGVSSSGGVIPDWNQAAEFLSRAGRIAAIADPNRGAGQLYSLVGWLRDHVGLTGAEDANERLAGKLEKVRESGGERAKAKRQRKYARIAKYGTDFPWKNALNKNASRIEILDDLVSIIGRENTAEWSEFGSEYSQGEIDKERQAVQNLFTAQDNRYRMLMYAIPWAEKAQKFYRGKIAKAQKNPSQKWLLPGYKKGLAAVTGLLDGSGQFSLRDDLKTLIGASGDRTGLGGTRGDTYFRLRELMGMKPGNAPGSSGISIGDLRQIIEFAGLGGYANSPLQKFHQGGDVGGSSHREIMAILQGQEGVFTPPQMGAVRDGLLSSAGPGDIRVIVHGDIVSDHPNPVEVVVESRKFKAAVQYEIGENNRAQDQQLKGAGV